MLVFYAQVAYLSDLFNVHTNEQVSVHMLNSCAFNTHFCDHLYALNFIARMGTKSVRTCIKAYKDVFECGMSFIIFRRALSILPDLNG